LGSFIFELSRVMGVVITVLLRAMIR